VASSTSTSGAPSDPAKAAKAKAAVLQPSDFPDGWQPGDPLDHETTWSDLTRCLGVEDSGQGLGRAVSPTFQRGPVSQVTSAVEYVPATSAPGLATAFAGPKLTACATEALIADVKRNAPEGSTVGAVEVGPLEFPKQGQLTASFRATTMLDLGFKIGVTQDFVFVLKGEAVARVSFLGAGQPFDAALQRTFVEKVVGRL